MDNQYGNDYNNQNYNNQYDPNMNQYPNGQYDQYGQYNQYNQYNQYDQQPMTPQQPNMMNQQMNYNQYPNQMDPNGGMMPQPYNAYENQRGGGVFGIILALILVVGLIGFLLDYTGTVNIRGLFKGNNNTKEVKKEEKAPEVNYEEEVEKMCSNVDTTGAYNVETYQRINAEMNTGNYTTPEQIWGLFKGNSYCFINSCAIYEDNKEHTVHYYDCTKEEYTKGVFEDYFGETMATAMCEYIDDNGNYTDSSGNEFCKDFTCAVNYNNKDYKKACS